MKLPCTSSPHPNTRLGSLPTAAASASSPSNGVVDVELRTMVQELLDRRWSPEQISQHLRRSFPDQPERHLVPETIYQAICDTHPPRRLLPLTRRHSRQNRRRSQVTLCLNT